MSNLWKALRDVSRDVDPTVGFEPALHGSGDDEQPLAPPVSSPTITPRGPVETAAAAPSSGRFQARVPAPGLRPPPGRWADNSPAERPAPLSSPLRRVPLGAGQIVRPSQINAGRGGNGVSDQGSPAARNWGPAPSAVEVPWIEVPDPPADVDTVPTTTDSSRPASPLRPSLGSGLAGRARTTEGAGALDTPRPVGGLPPKTSPRSPFANGTRATESPSTTSAPLPANGPRPVIGAGSAERSRVTGAGSATGSKLADALRFAEALRPASGALPADDPAIGDIPRTTDGVPTIDVPATTVGRGTAGAANIAVTDGAHLLDVAQPADAPRASKRPPQPYGSRQPIGSLQQEVRTPQNPPVSVRSQTSGAVANGAVASVPSRTSAVANGAVASVPSRTSSVTNGAVTNGDSVNRFAPAGAPGAAANGRSSNAVGIGLPEALRPFATGVSDIQMQVAAMALSPEWTPGDDDVMPTDGRKGVRRPRLRDRLPW